MGRLGATEILLILLIALLLFGPSKLADMGKGLGEGLKNFKKGISPEDHPMTPPPGEKPTAQAKPPEPPPAAANPVAPNPAAPAANQAAEPNKEKTPIVGG
jgi:sec-independent protein translocase protein TatA